MWKYQNAFAQFKEKSIEKIEYLENLKMNQDKSKNIQIFLHGNNYYENCNMIKQKNSNIKLQNKIFQIKPKCNDKALDVYCDHSFPESLSYLALENHLDFETKITFFQKLTK